MQVCNENNKILVHAAKVTHVSLSDNFLVRNVPHKGMHAIERKNTCQKDISGKKKFVLPHIREEHICRFIKSVGDEGYIQ